MEVWICTYYEIFFSFIWSFLIFCSSDWDSNNANSRGHGQTSVGTNNFGGYFCLHDCWLFYWSLWGKLIFSFFFLAKYVVKLENYGSSTNASEIRIFSFSKNIPNGFYASRTSFFSFEFFSLSSCELEIFLFHYALKIEN